ncbi:MAG: NUDIX hydrolase [Bacilli bacterium]|nr:NUDIX hydrolase [Bacilli bacterium]
MINEYANLFIRLKDDQYPFKGVTHVRDVARAIVLNEDGKIAIHRIYRNDVFCDQHYLETPGGGVDEGETPEEAVIRECEEELGYIVEVLEKIGRVDDFYNLIGRENHNFFFLCKIKEYKGKHFESDGDNFIQETIWIDIDEAISLYEKMEDTFVSKLVKQRELPMLKEAKKVLDNKVFAK